jgi:hypothetical protein
VIDIVWSIASVSTMGVLMYLRIRNRVKVTVYTGSWAGLMGVNAILGAHEDHSWLVSLINFSIFAVFAMWWQRELFKAKDAKEEMKNAEDPSGE